jgi:hypothetical protein
MMRLSALLTSCLVALCRFNAHTATASGSLAQPAAVTTSCGHPPINIDNFVTPWSEFGFHKYSFIGTWASTTYAAVVWLRLMPTPNSNERVARIVGQMSSVHPTYENGVDTRQLQAITPKRLLRNQKLPTVAPQLLLHGKLPAITFTGITPPGHPAEQVVVQLRYWPEEYITSQWLGGTINGRAVLKADMQYTMSMEGSKRLYQIPAFRCSETHAMFQDGDTWIGMPDALLAHGRQQPFQFLVLEHLRYHLRLGFKGTLMVVVPETAALLLAHRQILEVVKKKKLVLVLWVSRHLPPTPCRSGERGSVV